MHAVQTLLFVIDLLYLRLFKLIVGRSLYTFGGMVISSIYVVECLAFILHNLMHYYFECLLLFFRCRCIIDALLAVKHFRLGRLLGFVFCLLQIRRCQCFLLMSVGVNFSLLAILVGAFS